MRILVLPQYQRAQKSQTEQIVNKKTQDLWTRVHIIILR